MTHHPVIQPRLARQGFLKLWRKSDMRADRSMLVLDEVHESGSHRACSFPWRPRQVQDGDLIFMGCLVSAPNDILVYGRATGRRHQPGRDEASDAEKQFRTRLVEYPYYIRVDDPEYLAGTLLNGISVYTLMHLLGPDSFMSTQRNAARGTGNTNPRLAYTQKPSVQLTPQAIAWLTQRLEIAFTRHGKIPDARLQQLEWPDDPVYRGVRR